MAEYKKRSNERLLKDGLRVLQVRLPVVVVELIKAMAIESGKTRSDVIVALVNAANGRRP